MRKKIAEALNSPRDRHVLIFSRYLVAAHVKDQDEKKPAKISAADKGADRISAAAAAFAMASFPTLVASTVSEHSRFTPFR